MRLRPLFLFALPLALAAGVLPVACTTTTTTTTVAPVTGIVVRSDALVAGVGCGRGPGQVFKYAAVATQNGAGTPAQFSNVFDCFADATFVNLPVATNGDQGFTIAIAAFSEADYDRQNGKGALDAAATNPGQILGFAATWTTTCQAARQQDITVIAVCAPLVRVGPLPDAGADAASDAGDAAADATDADVDAARDAAADAADAGLADAAADAASEASADAGDGATDAPADGG